MKINEMVGLILITKGYEKNQHKTKYRSDKMDKIHFISSLFTLWASLSATTQQGGRAGDFHLQRY
jgi:hypothetical protein